MGDSRVELGGFSRGQDEFVLAQHEAELAALDPSEREIVANDARPRMATDPDGRTVTIHDTVLCTRRGEP